MSKKSIYIIVAAVLVVALAAVGVIFFYTSSGYVAKVGSEKITKAEYNFFLSDIKSRMEANANLADENARKTFWQTNQIEGQNASDVAKNKALDNAKEFKVQLIKARESKMSLEKSDNDAINSSIDNMIKQAGGRSVAESQIKSTYGVTIDEYKAIFQDYVLVSKFVKDQESKISPSDDEIKKYYTDNLETKDKVTVRHILISTVDATTQKPLPQDKQDEAKKKADDVYAKVKAGGNFGDLAKQYSEDPGSKDKNGQYTFGKGEMVKAFEDWSFSAKSGDIGLVKSDFGYHIMKKPTFDELKDDAKSGTIQSKYSGQLEEWKKDPKYNAVVNQRVYDSIKVI